MSDVLIRDFRSEDAKEVVRLHKESEGSFEESGISEEFILYVASRDDFKLFVAEKDSRPCGFCGMLYNIRLGRSEIGPIAVEGSYRKNGVGSLLIEKAVLFLKEKGIRRAIAKVKARNAGAREFFCSSGFSEEGYFREYCGDGEDAVQLVRFI